MGIIGWLAAGSWATEICDGIDTNGDPTDEAVLTVRGINYPTFRDALLNAAPNDAIQLCKSTTYETWWSLDLPAGSSIVGHVDPADGARPVLIVDGVGGLEADGALLLEDLVLDGRAVASGAVLELRGPSPLTTRNVLLDGAGIQVSRGGGNLDLVDSRIDARVAIGQPLGGMGPTHIELDGTVVHGYVTIQGGEIVNGTVQDGTGITSWGDLTMTGTVVQGNTAWGVSVFGNLVITGATIRHNQDTAGIYVLDGDVVMDSTLVEGNAAGIIVGGDLTATGSVVRDNDGPGVDLAAEVGALLGQGLLVRGNRTSDPDGGAGIRLRNGTVRNVWVEDNVSTTVGGGVAFEGMARIEGGWVSGNLAPVGAGVFGHNTPTASGNDFALHLGLEGTSIMANFGGGVAIEPRVGDTQQGLIASCTWWGDDQDDNIDTSGVATDLTWDRVYAYTDEEVSCHDTCVPVSLTCATRTRADVDADGLWDLFEPAWNLSPKSADQDRDGIVDGMDPSWLGAAIDGAVVSDPKALDADLADATAAAAAGDAVGVRQAFARIRQNLGCATLPAALGDSACDAVNQVAENLSVEDADEDGLRDTYESIWGLDPDLRDTDGDGRIDGIDPRWLGDRAWEIAADALELDGKIDEEGRRAALAELAWEAAGLAPKEPASAVDRLAEYAAGLADCKFGGADSGMGTPCDAVNAVAAGLAP